MSDIAQDLRQAAAEIRQEGHAGWGNTCAWGADEIERLTAERDDLRRQLDEAEQDARRYRYWLRGGANIPSHSARWARWEVRYWNGRHWNPLFAEQMDAAIDAAMRLTRG